MSDVEFIRSCIEQGGELWDEFLKRYSRVVYGAIHSVLRNGGFSSKHSPAVADLFQELFLFLVKDSYWKLRSYRGQNGCSFATWLRQVAVNHTIDFLRTSRRDASLDEEDAHGRTLAQLIADPGPLPAESAEALERAAALRGCVRELNSDEQLFLSLHFAQGVKLPALAQMSGISRPAADMRKQRLLQRLKECVRRKGFALDF